MLDVSKNSAEVLRPVLAYVCEKQLFYRNGDRHRCSSGCVRSKVATSGSLLTECRDSTNVKQVYKICAICAFCPKLGTCAIL